MKTLSLSICSLGLWVVLASFITGIWVPIVFGGITAILAFVAMFQIKS